MNNIFQFTNYIKENWKGKIYYVLEKDDVAIRNVSLDTNRLMSNALALCASEDKTTLELYNCIESEQTCATMGCSDITDKVKRNLFLREQFPAIHQKFDKKLKTNESYSTERLADRKVNISL